MPIEDVPAIATGLQLGIEELTRRAEYLRDPEQFRTRLVCMFQSTKPEPTVPEPTVSAHLERQLYDTFFPTNDETRMEKFHAVPWEDRLAITAAFNDRRLKNIGQRSIFLERPDLLPDMDRAQYDRAIVAWLSSGDVENLLVYFVAGARGA